MIFDNNTVWGNTSDFKSWFMNSLVRERLKAVIINQDNPKSGEMDVFLFKKEAAQKHVAGEKTPTLADNPGYKEKPELTKSALMQILGKK